MNTPTPFDTTIFRRYDIRGTLPAQFTVESAYAIVSAIMSYYQKQEPGLQTITLGRDGRTTSEALAAVVHRVCRERGIMVYDLGLCSSPEFYYHVSPGLTRGPDHLDPRSMPGKRPSSSGIMITASHNSTAYNGFKLRLGGKPVWGEQLQEIKQLALAAPPAPPSAYVAHLLTLFAHLKKLSYKVIIDCSNGAAGPAVRHLCTALQLPHVTLLNDIPDGTFPAHAPDPTKKEHAAALIALIRTAPQPTLGLALDGDGDRLVVILEDGTHCAGDELLALLATPVLTENPGAHVVYESKSSRRLTQHITNLGGVGHLVPCGHTHIHEGMEKHGALLGGEVSGHLFFADRYHGFDDGIYALLRVLELRQQHGPLIAQYAQLPIAFASAELRIPCVEEKKESIIAAVKAKWQNKPQAHLTTEDGVRVTLPDGWFLVRASQTEPMLSARCEGVSTQALQRLEKIIQALLYSSSEKPSYQSP